MSESQFMEIMTESARRGRWAFNPQHCHQRTTTYSPASLSIKDDTSPTTSRDPSPHHHAHSSKHHSTRHLPHPQLLFPRLLHDPHTTQNIRRIAAEDSSHPELSANPKSKAATPQPPPKVRPPRNSPRYVSQRQNPPSISRQPSTTSEQSETLSNATSRESSSQPRSNPHQTANSQAIQPRQCHETRHHTPLAISHQKPHATTRESQKIKLTPRSVYPPNSLATNSIIIRKACY